MSEGMASYSSGNVLLGGLVAVALLVGTRSRKGFWLGIIFAAIYAYGLILRTVWRL